MYLLFLMYVFGFFDSVFADEEEPPPLSHLLETFGPGTFATPEEIASDEENDAKLWVDIVQSIKQWQQSKVIKVQQRKNGLHR